MHVLMLSWEYPPVVVGGLGRHVHALSVALAEAGHDVTVLSRGDDRTAGAVEQCEGVRIVRAPADPALPPFSSGNILPWTLALNHALTRSGLDLAERFDVVHAHDWLVAHAAANLTRHTGAPLVVTVHSTEAGRHHGALDTDLNRTIHQVEDWLVGMADRVILCSEHMRREASRLFAVTPAKAEVIPNGVDRRRWQPAEVTVRAATDRYGNGGPLLVYAGRLVREKGLLDLFAATAALRRRHRGLRLVVAGDGHRQPQFADEARRLGLDDVIVFAGFLQQPQLAALMRAATVLVVPSTYEPFGMVALEAAAAGVPRVVAATGGLLEYVVNGQTALTFPPGDVPALTDAIERLIHQPTLADQLARRAFTTLESDYAWSTIAHRTTDAYRRAAESRLSLSFNL